MAPKVALNDLTAPKGDGTDPFEKFRSTLSDDVKVLKVEYEQLCGKALTGYGSGEFEIVQRKVMDQKFQNDAGYVQTMQEEYARVKGCRERSPPRENASDVHWLRERIQAAIKMAKKTEKRHKFGREQFPVITEEVAELHKRYEEVCGVIPAGKFWRDPEWLQRKIDEALDNPSNKALQRRVRKQASDGADQACDASPKKNLKMKMKAALHNEGESKKNKKDKKENKDKKDKKDKKGKDKKDKSHQKEKKDKEGHGSRAKAKLYKDANVAKRAPRSVQEGNGSSAKQLTDSTLNERSRQTSPLKKRQRNTQEKAESAEKTDAKATAPASSTQQQAPAAAAASAADVKSEDSSNSSSSSSSGSGDKVAANPQAAVAADAKSEDSSKSSSSSSSGSGGKVANPQAAAEVAAADAREEEGAGAAIKAEGASSDSDSDSSDSSDRHKPASNKLAAPAWEEMISEEYGIPFWFNAATDESVWEKPEELKTEEEKSAA